MSRALCRGRASHGTRADGGSQSWVAAAWDQAVAFVNLQESAHRLRSMRSLPGRRKELLRHPRHHHLPAAVAALGSQVDDPVRLRDDVQIVLDEHHGVTGVHQPMKNADQLLDVRHVQAYGGLVEHVERVAETARREVWSRCAPSQAPSPA